MPLGRDSENGLLRAPSSWPRGESWPPSVKKAKAVLKDAASRPRRGGGVRGRMRSALALFNYGGALAYRAIEEPWRRGDLVEAFAIFVEIAESENTHHFGRYRPLALYNATALVQMVPAKKAIGLAGRLARAALMAVASEASQQVHEQFVLLQQQIEARSTAYAYPAQLRWSLRGPKRLIPECHRGKVRVNEVPRPGFRGTWGGVSGMLSDYGLGAPNVSAFPGPLHLQPQGSSLVATQV